MKKIMAVALESPKKAKAYAVYDGERMVVLGCTQIAGPPSEWKQDLLDEIQDKVNEGFVVLVEDRTGTFCEYGTQFSFEEEDDGRTMLHHALDWWTAMQGVGNLLVEPEVERFNIRVSSEGSMIDRQQDDKGRVKYNVQWQSFQGGHKAVLMCVVAAMMEPISERYLEAMFAADDAANAIDDPPFLRTLSALQKHDNKLFAELDKAND